MWGYIVIITPKLLHNDTYEEIIKLLFPWIIRDKEKCVKWIYFIKIKEQKVKVWE